MQYAGDVPLGRPVPKVTKHSLIRGRHGREQTWQAFQSRGPSFPGVAAQNKGSGV